MFKLNSSKIQQVSRTQNATLNIKRGQNIKCPPFDFTELGFNALPEQLRIDTELDGFAIGRVIEEHKERYKVLTKAGEYEAEVLGALRFTAKSREEFPAVGDWVALSTYDNDFAIIHKILPRFSTIKRQAVGQFGEIQIIATNIDYAFIVQAVDRDFNINRLERYLTICYSSKVSPVIVLTKTDLITGQQLAEILESINKRINNIPVIAISNETQDGYELVKAMLKKGKTYCMLGSSGVGKSTLSNNLSGKPIMKTDAISLSTHKGRHVTSHRELIVLESGGILIDNPGMREIGIADTDNGLASTFDRIVDLSHNCRFKDCKHTNELGCAVLEAVSKGELDKSSYENYLKMEREKAHFESSVEEKRKKDKQFGKMLRNYKKDIKSKYLK
jgi:ribosome biogenesis GTPase